MHLVGHFLNLVVLSFVCCYLVNFRWCDRPTIPHEWFLKTISQRSGETGFCVLSSQKLSRQHPFGLLKLQPSGKDPVQKSLPPQCGHTSAHTYRLLQWQYCSRVFPQVVAKPAAAAQVPALLTPAVRLSQVLPRMVFMIFCFLTRGEF